MGVSKIMDPKNPNGGALNPIYRNGNVGFVKAMFDSSLCLVLLWDPDIPWKHVWEDGSWKHFFMGTTVLTTGPMSPDKAKSLQPRMDALLLSKGRGAHNTSQIRHASGNLTLDHRADFCFIPVASL